MSSSILRHIFVPHICLSIGMRQGSAANMINKRIEEREALSTHYTVFITPHQEPRPPLFPKRCSFASRISMESGRGQHDHRPPGKLQLPRTAAGHMLGGVRARIHGVF